MKIIGITGTIGAGKGTVVEHLVTKGFKHYSSSDLLREVLKERGVFIDRDALAAVAREIRSGDPAGVPKLSYQRAIKEGSDTFVLEAIHTTGEADFVRSVGGLILSVDADVDTRYERIKKRGSDKDNVSYEKFVEQSRREDDGAEGAGHNIRAVINGADVVLTNNGTIEELYAKVDEALGLG